MVAFAAALGQPLFPWQEQVVVEGMRYAGNGNYLHRTVGLLVARQNGKSHLLRTLALAQMVLKGSRVVTMAQNVELMEEQMDFAFDALTDSPFASEIDVYRKGNGRRALILKNGAKWTNVAATESGPRGKTADWVWVDELREIEQKAWTAIRPVIRSKPNGQLWATSNAGDLHSDPLNNLRASALVAKDSTIAWLEYSADPTYDLADVRGWAQANPSLGHTLTLETLQADFAVAKPEEWITESLCRWVDALDSPWPHGKWGDCEDKSMELAPGQPTWVAIDVSPDRRRADVVLGQMQGDRIAVAVVQSFESPTAIDDLMVANEAAKWYREFTARAVLFDRWTAANIAARLTSAGIIAIDISGHTFAQACDETLSAMNSGRLMHSGQPELTSHVMSCARRPAADGGWRIVRKNSAGYITAACAMVMIVHHAVQPQGSGDIIFI